MLRSHLTLAVLGTAALWAATVVAANPPCDPEWSDQFPASRLDKWVWDLVVFDDGSGPAVYAGGGFSVAGEGPADYIAKLDGQVWKPLGNGLDTQPWDLAACQECPDPGPNLYAGGWFTQAGEAEVSGIARWDGTSWWPLGTGIGGDPLHFVYTVTVANDVTGQDLVLYVGGLFTTAGGVSANSIAKWDGETWLPLGDGFPGESVSALAVFDDGSGDGPALYAAGYFTMAGSVPANNIARWDGQAWSPVGDGLDGNVDALAVFNDGSGPALYAGGSFMHAGGVEAARIARWDGSSWAPVGGGVNYFVNELAVVADGSRGGSALYVGGQFSTAGVIEAKGIAKWDGTTWSALGSGVRNDGLAGSVQGIAVLDDHTLDDPVLYAGGFFDHAGDVAADYAAKWDGATWTDLGNGINDYWGVTALEVSEEASESDPSLYVGGNFTAAGGMAARSVAAWDGTEWSALGEGLDGRVEAMAFVDDGSGAGATLYAGGSFADPDGGQAGSIAQWDGETWHGVGGGVDGNVCALEVHDDGTGPALYVGGTFTQAGGTPATNIARWDGKTWSPVGEGLPDGDLQQYCAVRDMAVFDDGTGAALYAGGVFWWEGDNPDERGVAKWDGNTWSALPDLPGLVLALAVFDDEPDAGPALHVGGRFSVDIDGADLSGIAKWDGASWSALGAGLDPTLGVSYAAALAVYDDGTGGGPALYMGGSFHGVDGVEANLIAAWDGNEWSPLGVGMAEPQLDQLVRTIAVFDEGTGEGPALFAGGAFATAGGLDSWHIAKWGGCAGPPPGDLDGDGIVGIEDYEILLDAWGPCPPPCPPGCRGDLDGNCDVGITDFLIMLANWG